MESCPTSPNTQLCLSPWRKGQEEPDSHHTLTALICKCAPHNFSKHKRNFWTAHMQLKSFGCGTKTVLFHPKFEHKPPRTLSSWMLHPGQEAPVPIRGPVSACHHHRHWARQEGCTGQADPRAVDRELPNWFCLQPQFLFAYFTAQEGTISYFQI